MRASTVLPDGPEARRFFIRGQERTCTPEFGTTTVVRAFWGSLWSAAGLSRVYTWVQSPFRIPCVSRGLLAGESNFERQTNDHHCDLARITVLEFSSKQRPSPREGYGSAFTSPLVLVACGSAGSMAKAKAGVIALWRFRGVGLASPRPRSRPHQPTPLPELPIIDKNAHCLAEAAVGHHVETVRLESFAN